MVSPQRIPTGTTRQIPAETRSAQTAAKASGMALLVPIPVRLALQSPIKEAGPNAWMLNLVSLAVTVVNPS